MNDAELKQKFDELHGCLEVLADAIADQQVLHAEVLAHHMALETAIRDFLAKYGEDKTMLDHRILATYERAKQIVQAHIALLQQSGGAKQSPDIPPILPDETQRN